MTPYFNMAEQYGLSKRQHLPQFLRFVNQLGEPPNFEWFHYDFVRL
jgi:hypothetical protein